MRERKLRSLAESFARRTGLFISYILLLYKIIVQVKHNHTIRICSPRLEGQKMRGIKWLGLLKILVAESLLVNKAP